MPVYNSERWLPAAIESILQQNYGNFELIISDNASTDSSYDVCHRFAAQDRRIRLVRQPTNLGATRNYRFVADVTDAPFFKWATGSDLISDNFLAECLAVLERREDVALAFGESRLFTEAPEDASPYDDDMDLEVDDPIARFVHVLTRLKLNNVMNGIIRRSALLRTSVMPQFFSSDNLVLAELALVGKIVRAPDAVFYRRMRAETATRLKSSLEVVRHLYPEKRIGMLMQNWQLQAAYTRAAWRAPLPFADRCRLLAFTGKVWWWNGARLWSDIVDAGRYFRGYA
jgi:glycosyltransferase involved in cell wall biosynthesis